MNLCAIALLLFSVCLSRAKAQEAVKPGISESIALKDNLPAGLSELPVETRKVAEDLLRHPLLETRLVWKRGMEPLVGCSSYIRSWITNHDLVVRALDREGKVQSEMTFHGAFDLGGLSNPSEIPMTGAKAWKLDVDTKASVQHQRLLLGLRRKGPLREPDSEHIYWLNEVRVAIPFEWTDQEICIPADAREQNRINKLLMEPRAISVSFGERDDGFCMWLDLPGRDTTGSIAISGHVTATHPTKGVQLKIAAIRELDGGGSETAFFRFGLGAADKVPLQDLKESSFSFESALDAELCEWTCPKYWTGKVDVTPRFPK